MQTDFYGIRTPTSNLWHTNPDFCAICAVFIGGGGGIQYIEIIGVKASSHSWPVPVGLSWNFRGPPKNISGIVQGFRGLFTDVPAPPAVENMHEPTALQITEENIFLSPSAAPTTRLHVRGQ